MIRFKLLFLVFVFLLSPAMIMAQSPLLQKKDDIYAIGGDRQGNRLEGYLQLYPNEISVSTKDNKEKSIPLEMIESIKVEKIQGPIPAIDKLGGDSYYSVRLQNSQEIFTLQKKVTVSLNTSVGVVVKTVDPEAVRDSSLKDSSFASKHESSPLSIRDKNVVFSLEIKF
jgi:hypothetical protein